MAKQQRITKQEDGSYRVVLGIADGITQTNIKFDRAVIECELARLNARNPFAEWGYPVRLPEVGPWEAHARLQSIHMDRVCGKWSDFAIECMGWAEDPDVIVGTFRPWGPMTDDVVKLLDHNPPLARFGYRALTFDLTVDGQRIPEVKKIITWDMIPND